MIHAARLAVLIAGSAAVASLPSSMAAADSHVQTTVPGETLSATAHVNFRIVIPQVLSLRVADRALGARTVAVMSNSRNVTLTATGPGNVAVAGNVSGPGNVILSAAGRKMIAQAAPCAGSAPVVCTVAMP